MTTRRQERERWEALAPVRGAIRGWAFAHASGLRSRLEAGIEAVARVPTEHYAAAWELLRPLQEALRPQEPSDE